MSFPANLGGPNLADLLVSFSPVAEVALEGEQVLIDTLEGSFLQHIIDPTATVKHAHLDVLLLSFSTW